MTVHTRELLLAIAVAVAAILPAQAQQGTSTQSRNPTPSASGSTTGAAVAVEAPAAAAASTSTTTPAVAAPATATTATAVAPPAKADRLRITTFGGAYGESQRLAFFGPFAEASGIRVDVREHGADAAAVLTGTPDFDVADVPLGLAETACAAGALAELDHKALPAASDGTTAAADFLDGGLTRCAVASVAWSSLILVNDGAFKGRKPQSIADIFDIKGFPGVRALPRDPRYLLEMALMADGVAPAEIYVQLRTDAGKNRALIKIASIARDVVWWTQPSEALALLADKKVAVALAFSGRAFTEIAGDLKPYRPIWDGQVYDLDVWVAAKSSKFPVDAAAFIAFASSPERLAEQARWFPYGPMRRSAVQLVGNHAVLGVALEPFLPTAPRNLVRALRFDDSFWTKEGAAVGTRLDAIVALSRGSAG